MKKIILLAAGLFILTTATQAQETTQKPVSSEKKQRMTPEQRAQKQVDNLNTEVVLTDAQKPKIYDLALAKAKKVDELTAKLRSQPETKDATEKEIMAAKKDFRKSLKAVLTTEQQEKLKAKQAEKKNSGKEHSSED